MESWSLGLLAAKSQTETEKPSRRYEVIRERSDNLQEEVVTIAADSYEWDTDEVHFFAADVMVYLLDRKRLVSIRDLGPAETKEAE